MTTSKIALPFAQSGTKTPIDTTSATGVVNLTQGYTEDYSRELGVDPAAKAVERDKMNWLMNLITTNIIDWQNSAVPQWLGATAYAVNALVRYTPNAGQDERIYRCVSSSSANILPTNTNFWEEMITVTAIKNLIPMLNLGDISTPTDFNLIVNGFWRFSLPGIVTSSPNAPSVSVDAGILECYRWSSGASNYAMQRYEAVDGSEFIRGYNGSSWQAWQKVASRGTTLASYGIVDAWYGKGTDLEGDVAIPNTAIATTGESHVRVSNPGASWQAQGYPVQLPGVLITSGYSSSGTTWSQYQQYMDNSNSMWTRFGSNGTWQAWQKMGVNTDAIIANLLARDNLWTGSNTWSGVANFNRFGGLSYRGLAGSYALTGDFGAGVSANLNNGAIIKSFVVQPNGDNGLFDNNLGRWTLLVASDGTLATSGSTFSINQYKSGVVSAIRFNTNAAGVVPTFQYNNQGAVGQFELYVPNAAGTAYSTTIFYQNGSFSAPLNITAGQDLLAQTGNVYAGTNASLRRDGNVTGPVWGADANVFAYVSNTKRYITNFTGVNDIRLYYFDSHLQMNIDGSYVGAVPNTADLAAKWGKSEWFRPDQSQYSTFYQVGQATCPAGGTWFYFAILGQTTGTCRGILTGTLAGGTTIFASTLGQDQIHGYFQRIF